MKKSGLKKWIAAAMALVMSVSVFGCGTANTPGTTENNSVDESKIVVAKVGDYEITKAEFREEFEYARQAQTRQTMQDPVVDAETLVTFQNEILEGLTVKYMELYQMKQQGFDTLTEAEEAEIQEKLDANREALEAAQREMAYRDFEEDPELDIEERVQERIQELIDKAGMNMTVEEYWAWLKEDMRTNKMLSNMTTHFSESIVFTEEELTGMYNQYLSEDEAEMSSEPSLYRNYQDSFEADGGIPSLYIPEGYVRVKQIFITSETEPDTQYSDKLMEIEELQREYQELLLPDENTGEADDTDAETTEKEPVDEAYLEELRQKIFTAREEAQQIIVDHYAPVLPKINEAYDKLEAGEDFEAVMAQYSMDKNFEENEIWKEKGRLLGEHITLDTYTNPDWSDAVKEEVLKLTEIGSYTKPVMDEDGYHIFQLVGFEEPGVRSYNEVKEYIKEVAMPDRLTAEWSKQMDIWLTDPALVTMYVENMRDVGLDTLAAEEAKQG